MTMEEQRSLAWVDGATHVVDPRWQRQFSPIGGQVVWGNGIEGLVVILSADLMGDGRRWLHFSMVAKTGLPSWEQLVRAKEAILGSESKAIQVIAPRSEWVNIHSKCLHQFVCLDGDPLPDFTMGSKSL